MKPMPAAHCFVGKYDESQVFAGNDISYNPNSSVHCKAVVLDPDDYLQWRQALAAKDHTTARKFVDPTQYVACVPCLCPDCTSGCAG